MNFNPLNKILNQLEQQPGWENFRDYRQLVQCWQNTVNQNTAKYTRPLYIQRQILFVATNSAARSQELSFQRYALLKRLNKQLASPLKDIRFSASGWEQTTYETNAAKILFKLASRQKSKKSLREPAIPAKRIENIKEEKSSPKQAQAVVKAWLNKRGQNQENSSLLLCSNCGSPTPTGEIERWNLCYLCVAQKWSQEYRPPNFPESK